MSAEQPHCHVCALVEGDDALYRGETFSAFTLAGRPGWVMFATNRHGEWAWGFTDQEAQQFGPVLAMLSDVVRTAAETSHVYYVGLGENTLHFHGILMPQHLPFAKDVQAALASSGQAVNDDAEAARLRALMESALAGREPQPATNS